jgi:histone H3/H4
MPDLIKKKGVREAAKGMNVGSDFYTALDQEVIRLVDRAVERADENNRKTVKARDV